VVTPNRYEAQLLSGLEIHTLDDMKVAAQRIHQLGAKTVLVKGEEWRAILVSMF